MRRPRTRRPWGAIAIFLGPTVVLYAAFTIYPVLVMTFDRRYIDPGQAAAAGATGNATSSQGGTV